MTDYEKETMAKTLEKVELALRTVFNEWKSPAAYGLYKTADEIAKLIEELRS